MMASIQGGGAPALAGDLITSREPFSYFFGAGCLEDARAKALLKWFENGIDWQLHESDFFKQFESDLMDGTPPEDCRWLFDEGWQASLREQVGYLFGEKLTERMTIVAHRLIPGHGIGIHNDAPTPGMETHRLVIQVNRGFQDGNGGHLLFFNSRNQNDVHRAFRPLHNSCVGFELSTRSYHGVFEIAKGIRYTLVISFWAEEAARIASEQEALLAFLRSIHSSAAAQKNEDVVARLIRLESLLESWGYDQHVCAAALFHNAYEAINPAAQPVTQVTRENVRRFIGSRAERLVFLSCGGSRDFIDQNQGLRWTNAGSAQLSDAETDELVAIHIADMTEHLGHTTLTRDSFRAGCQEFMKAAPFLRSAAVEDTALALIRADSSLSDRTDELESSLVRFLREEGAGDVQHSGTNLLVHLVNVYLLLREWDCPSHLRIAGLCHSLYGWRTAPTSADRNILADVIGNESERILYCYASIPASEWLDALEAGGSNSSDMRHAAANEGMVVSYREMLDLLVLEAANILEPQLRGIRATTSNEPQIKRLCHLLPQQAQSALLTQFV